MTTSPKQFVLYRDASSEWRWTLYAENGRRIADSAEGYINRADAIHGARRVAAVATDCPIWEPQRNAWVPLS